MRRRGVIFMSVIIFMHQYCHCSDPCSNVVTCGECIQNPKCAWCVDKTKIIKCIQLDKNNKIDCEANLITGQGMEEIKVITNEDISTESGLPSQMKPQQMSLKIPKNKPTTIKFEFARDWNELDLYFLMDNSHTMAPHRKMLSTLGIQLRDAMTELTKDFRMGFGSFVEKQTFPFDYHENKKGECERAYSFKNHIPLTNDTTSFVEDVSTRNSTCNVDTIEGGLDALVQVLSCGTKLGWRKDTTKIVVFSTDAGFHVAGDGKLGGISIPNDGLCHTSGGEYTHDEKMDYPSVSQVGHLMEENGIYVIFAIVCNETDVHDHTCKTYQSLAQHTSERLANFTVLHLNSKSVVDILTTTYNNIIQSVNMTHTFTSDIDVNFRVLCHGVWMDSASCTNLKTGDKVKFEAILEPQECLDGVQTFKIQPVGVTVDFLEIDLEVICECDCEKNGPEESNAEHCGHRGDLECGLCACEQGFSGRRCECSSNSTHSLDESQCVDPSTNLTCSGFDNGQCICGICICGNNFHGKFCQCQDLNCKRNKELLCSGRDHGSCVCGKCKCTKDWTGEDCSCSRSVETCKTFYSRNVCFGHGTCECGSCKCEDGFYGAFCEGCVVNENGTSAECDRCNSFISCVQSFNNMTVSGTNNTDINCTAIHYTSVTADSLKAASPEWEKCIYYASGCTTAFRFKDGEDGSLIMEVGPEQCAFIASLEGLFTIIGVTFALALLGLLFWKFLVTVNDKREYANFLEKRQAEKWHNITSPIYKAASYTYKNPMYRGGKE